MPNPRQLLWNEDTNHDVGIRSTAKHCRGNAPVCGWGDAKTPRRKLNRKCSQQFTGYVQLLPGVGTSGRRMGLCHAIRLVKHLIRTIADPKPSFREDHRSIPALKSSYPASFATSLQHAENDCLVSHFAGNARSRILWTLK